MMMTMVIITMVGMMLTTPVAMKMGMMMRADDDGDDGAEVNAPLC